MLPTYMLAITPRKRSGYWKMKRGPGWTPYIINAPRSIAMVGLVE